MTGSATAAKKDADKKTKIEKKIDEHLETGLEDSFPASDPPAATVPAAEDIIPPGAGAPPPPREEKILTDRKLTRKEKERVEK